jgi:8-oxo-dGTP diphosphatase
METRVVAKVVLVNARGQLLLLRRSKDDIRRPLQWDMPGGHTDGDEFANEAAAREIVEEAGITIDARQLQLVYSITAIPEPGLNIIWLFYIGNTEVTEVQLSHEHDQFQWMSLAQAIEALEYPRQREVLEYIRDNSLLNS